MATTFKVFVNGVYRTFTAAEYETEFGYKPTSPRTGERMFGGRYENRTFYTASENEKNSSDDGLYSSIKNIGNDSGSYNLDL